MKTPVWVWDKKQKIYLRLPEGIQQFEDGTWGYDIIAYTGIPTSPVSDFHNKYEYLFKFVAGIDPYFTLDRRVVLRSTKPQDKHWYSKDKARITKVQR